MDDAQPRVRIEAREASAAPVELPEAVTDSFGEDESEAAAESGLGRRSAHAGEAVEVVPDELVEVEEERQDTLTLPVHSVRSETRGPRGCWAISNRTGEPCGAAARKGEDYCNAHSGIGVAGSPSEFSQLGNAKRRENGIVRARLRAALGTTRVDSPRGVLKAMAYAERERVARAALDGALRDPRLALRLIDAVDPPLQAELNVAMPTTVEAVEQLGLAELRALSEQYAQLSAQDR